MRYVPVRRLAARHWEHEQAGTGPLPAFEAVPAAVMERAKTQHTTTARRECADESGLWYRETLKNGAAFGRSEVPLPTEPWLCQIADLAHQDLGIELGAFNREDLLFFDTETTGLSRSSGTLAFMIGVGFFTKDGLVVDQILIDDPGRERDALILLEGYLERAKLLVSFNGRAFDAPLLEARSIVNRLPLSLDIPHLDLLPIARRLWRSRLADCRLGTLEREILGFHRVRDLPGSEAPAAYMRFLQDGVFDELAKVLEHNLWDVISLAVLLDRLSKHVLDPLRWAEDAQELLAAGRYWSAGRHAPGRHTPGRHTPGRHAPGRHTPGGLALSETCLRRAADMATLPLTRRRSLEALGLLLRQAGRRAEAAVVWRDFVSEFPLDPMGWVELSKYNEHQLKNLPTALEYARGIPEQDDEDVQRRVRRLEGRVAARSGVRS